MKQGQFLWDGNARKVISTASVPKWNSKFGNIGDKQRLLVLAGDMTCIEFSSMNGQSPHFL